MTDRSAGTRGHLYYEVEGSDTTGSLRIVLAGCVDEHADLEAVRARIGDAGVTLDLAGIDAMNSAGISRWISFLERLTRTPGRRVTLTRCSFDGFVMHAAMIANMGAGAAVESILAPYACECDEELRLVTGWTELDEERMCPECEHVFELDVSPDLFVPIFGPRA